MTHLGTLWIVSVGVLGFLRDSARDCLGLKNPDYMVHFVVQTWTSPVRVKVRVRVTVTAMIPLWPTDFSY